MRIFFYIILFAAILFLSNYFYTFFGLYDQDIKKCNAELVYEFDSCDKNNNIIYFGESSNFTFSETDSIKNSISELVNELNPKYKILTISKGAIHTKVYKTFVERLSIFPNIKTIIITVNLRSFGINWIESNLETNLSRANIFYTNYPPIIKKLLISFKAYDNKELFQRKEIIRQHYKKDKFKLRNLKFETVAQWDKEVFNKGIRNIDGGKNQVETDIACHFIKNYAFKLNENNPRIIDLDEIVDICEAKKINVVFNLLPENYQRATKLCGNDLEILMRSNVVFLKNRYEKKTVFIDNFDLLEDKCFIDRDWPTEHYNGFGRSVLAQRIDKRLRLLPCFKKL